MTRGHSRDVPAAASRNNPVLARGPSPNLLADEAGQVDFRIITHNIRYATQRPFVGEELWSTRCPRMCSELAFNAQPEATFVCLQEVLHQQLLDIHTALNAAAEGSSTWAYIGKGRDDGKKAGEYSPIFYRPAAWKLKDWHTVWLSETPGMPSKGWDAACIRIVTVGLFTHQRTNQDIVVMSTHLDHQGAKSREESAKMILELVTKYQASSDPLKPHTVILGGDFNSPPGQGAYKIMTAPGSSMVDVRGSIAKPKRYGHHMTFTSFGEAGSTPSLIDFIFCNKKAPCLCKTFAVLENVFDDGVYLSDHRAVAADMTLIR